MRDETTIRARRAPEGDSPTVTRRSPGALAVSVALHLALAVFLARVVAVPVDSLTRLFARGEAPVEERVAWVDAATAPGAPAAEPAAGPPPPPLGEPDARDDAPAPAPPAERLAAPLETPTAPPAPAAPAAGRAEGVPGGAGAPGGTGGGGAGAGLRPTYTDSPLWIRPEVMARRPLGLDEKLDSAVARDFEALRDSAVAAANRRQPGDWTFERNGQTYGMDQKYIRLGKVSIPTALLGLLNFTNAQANPVQLERDRRLSQMRREIQEQAGRMQTETDLRDVIAEVRARKDRERAARRAAAGSGGR